MLATLLTATGPTQSFSWSGLVIVLIVFAVVFPIQSLVRKKISEGRRRRWAEQEPQHVPQTDSGRPATPSSDERPSVDDDPSVGEKPPPDDESRS